MRACKFEPLHYNGRITPEFLSGAFPDVRKRKKRLSKGFNTLKTLFQALDYKEPAELFTMYGCWFLDRGVVTVPVRWLVEHEARLSRERAVYVRLHGQNPHPAVL